MPHFCVKFSAIDKVQVVQVVIGQKTIEKEQHGTTVWYSAHWHWHTATVSVWSQLYGATRATKKNAGDALWRIAEKNSGPEIPDDAHVPTAASAHASALAMAPATGAHDAIVVIDSDSETDLSKQPQPRIGPQKALQEFRDQRRGDGFKQKSATISNFCF